MDFLKFVRVARVDGLLLVPSNRKRDGRRRWGFPDGSRTARADLAIGGAGRGWLGLAR